MIDAYEQGRQAGILESQDSRLAALEAKVTLILEHVNQSKGGFSILMKVGTASTAIGAGLATLIPWVMGWRPHG